MSTAEASLRYQSDHERCAQEPIHIIGSIQPHGALVALSEPDLVVRQVSANIAAFCGVTPEEVLGGSLEAVIGSQQFAAFQLQVSSGEQFANVSLILHTPAQQIPVQCVAHREDDVLIVELNLQQNCQSLHPLDLDDHIRLPFSRMEAAPTTAELSQVTAREIRRLSGFDRVMIYRFDHEGNGEVLAEASLPSPVSYLGLTFPATDIPPQVRLLLLRNPVRPIADVNALSVPICPEINPLTGRPLDLSRSWLRSASAVHLEYLRNMDVRASLAISVVVDDKLWGIIACHHGAPYRLDNTIHSICEMISQKFALQMVARSRATALQSELSFRRAFDERLAELESSKGLVPRAHSLIPNLYELLGADGQLSHIDGLLTSQGARIEPGVLAKTIHRLRGLSTAGIASTDRVQEFVADISGIAVYASGALYLSLSAEVPREGEDYLLFLRKESSGSIHWAGNPNQTVTTDDQNRLHPRASFEAWRELTRGRSAPWTEVELERAFYIRGQLLRLRELEAIMCANELAARADEANAAKSAFLANMSHEIRTPMNGVLGMLQMVKQDDLSEENCHFLRVAENSGRVLLALINDILDLSKIEAGMLEMEALQFDLHECLSEAAELYQYQAGEKGVSFNWEATPTLPRFVVSDKVRLRQVLNNLCSNAIKFTAQGEINLAVGQIGSHNGKAILRFTVTDTGMGIPKERAASLFSPFVQADLSTTRKFGGTGLGLAICKHLVELMAGKIGFESEEGSGSTFWFTIEAELTREPRRSARPPVFKRAPEDHHTVSGIDFAAKGAGRADSDYQARILIADDNWTNGQVALAQLTRLGYAAEIVVDGSQALERVKEGRFDLVLMDCEMPVMDGFTATEQIRRTVSPNIPILAVTAHANLEIRERCLRSGMNDFISKPVDVRLLEQTLTTWLPRT